MSSMLVFLLLLALGIVLAIVGKLLKSNLRVVLYVIGAVLIIFGGYGVFTSFF